MKRCQINLVVSEKKFSKDESGIHINTFLVALTFFSRYIFHRSLKSIDTIEGANQLKEIFMTGDRPKILQCDKGLTL